jgi:acyl-CoA synthetase (AMP-forming)/AMP-acid ligase II
MRHAGWQLIGDDDLGTGAGASSDGLAGGPVALNAAWTDDASLLLAPARRGVTETWLREAIDRVPPELARGHVALLTSGSTGAPRLVVGEKARAERLAGVMHDRQALDDVERTVTLLPLTYSYAFVNQWVWSHAHGRAVVTSPGLADVAATRALLREGPDTMVCLVGPLFSLLARHVEGTEALASVTRVNFAGGPFPWHEREALARVLPRARVFNNYGCAEAMPRLTITPLEALRGPGDLGEPLPGVELRVDEHGELRFRSAYGAIGLVEDGTWREVGAEDWLGTQDLALADDDGRFTLLGRRSEVYKRFGEKVSVAQQLDAVREVWPGQAAAMMERDPAGEPAHVVVLAPEPSDDEVRGVLKVFRARFPRAHWPLRVDSVDALPLLASGKPDLRALAAATRRVRWQLPL